MKYDYRHVCIKEESISEFDTKMERALKKISKADYTVIEVSYSHVLSRFSTYYFQREEAYSAIIVYGILKKKS